MVNERLSRNEREFVRSCLQEGGLRADGRSLDGTRPLTVRLGPAPGLAEVTLGSTRCVAQVAVDATTPFPDRPEEGLVTISAQFSSLAGEQFTAPTWYGMRDDELTRSIERTMRDTRAIESESLCILAGKLVWAVRISVQIIDYDGNALDAATAAVSAALLHARRPDVTISGDDVRIHSAEEREPVPLPVVHTPVTASFATFEDTASGRIYLALDPSLQEEGAMDGSLSLSANIHQEICGIYKAGGVPLEAATILRCAQLTLARAEEVTLDIQQALRLQPTAGMLTLGSVVPDTVTDLSEPNTAEPSPTENNAPGPKRQKRSVAGEHPASSGDNDLQPPPNQPPPGMSSVDGHADSANIGTTRVFPSRNPEHGAHPSRAAVATNGNRDSSARSDDSDGSDGSDESDGSNKSDEDLMTAVISKPRGGRGRR